MHSRHSSRSQCPAMAATDNAGYGKLFILSSSHMVGILSVLCALLLAYDCSPESLVPRRMNGICVQDKWCLQWPCTGILVCVCSVVRLDFSK